jgi:hypothetical protein
MPSPKLKVQTGPTGLTLWGPLPETTDFYLMWGGPGSRLRLAIRPLSVDGTSTTIEHPTANGTYDTRREAAAAVAAFAASFPEDPKEA